MNRLAGSHTRLSPACLCAGVLLVAVAGAVDPWGFRPFTTWRWAVVGVAAAAAASLTPWRPPRRMLLAWAGLLACLALATATALDPLVAAVGHPRRHLGLAGWLVGALAFLAGTGLDAGEVRRYLGRAAVVAGAVTGAAALADLAGWDPAGSAFAGGRIGGLLGQPTYLGAVAVLLAPLAVGVAADPATPVWWRRGAVVAAGSCGVAVLAAQTRGAWLGAAVAAGVAWRAVGRWAAAHRPSAAAGAAVLGALVLIGPIGERGAAAFDPSGDGGRGRLDEWALAASVISDHPLTGVGPEGYRIAAPAHIDDRYARLHGRDEVVDRAHDGPLDVAVSAGLPAAVLYVALLAGVVTRCARAVCLPPGPVMAGAAAGVLAWAVQQVVSFPIAEVDPAAWLLAGAVAVAVEARPATPARGAPLRLLAGAFACLLAAGGALAVAADRDLHRAERGAAAAGPAALRAADRATGRRPDDLDAWYVAARIASSRPSLLAVDAGLDRVEAGLRRSPRDPALRSLHEALLVERALRSGLPADLRAAEDAAEALVTDDPSAPDHHRRLGLVLASQGERGRAAAELRRALELDPGDTAARAALDDVRAS
jgi:O-antigen ligase